MGILLLTVVIAASGCLCFTVFGKELREQIVRDVWGTIFDHIDWENFPWDTFPWDTLPEDFPWDILPWEDLPWDQIAEQLDWEDFPWDEVDWSSLEDFPFDEFPWDKLPDDFPFEDIPWDKMDWSDLQGIPFDEIPFDQLSDEFWQNLDWYNLPPDFPWQDVPWQDLPPEVLQDLDWSYLPEGFTPDMVPWDQLPDEFWDNLDWDALPEDMPLDQIPWEDLPPDVLESFDWGNLPPDFPVDEIPWEDLPPEVWQQLDWTNLPEDMPYDRIPWDDLPPEVWQDMDWTNLPEDFPWQDVPWEDMPDSFWQDFPFKDIPPVALLAIPWLLINPDLIPPDALPDDFYPWDHEHQFATDWVVTEPNNCGKAGKHVNLCTLCKQLIEEELPPTGEHNFGSDGICTVCDTHKLILKAANITKEYDGTPLTCSDGGYEPFDYAEGSARLLEGHHFNLQAFTFSSCDEMGSVPHQIEKISDDIILDASGNDVTSQYVVEEEIGIGVLTITLRKITILTGSARDVYGPDMPPVQNNSYRIIEGNLVAGHQIVDVVYVDPLYEQGECDNQILYFRIVDENGNDVTDNYNVEFEWGLLEVLWNPDYDE